MYLPSPDIQPGAAAYPKSLPSILIVLQPFLFTFLGLLFALDVALFCHNEEDSAAFAGFLALASFFFVYHTKVLRFRILVSLLNDLIIFPFEVFHFHISQGSKTKGVARE